MAEAVALSTKDKALSGSVKMKSAAEENQSSSIRHKPKTGLSSCTRTGSLTVSAETALTIENGSTKSEISLSSEGIEINENKAGPSSNDAGSSSSSGSVGKAISADKETGATSTIDAKAGTSSDKRGSKGRIPMYKKRTWPVSSEDEDDDDDDDDDDDEEVFLDSYYSDVRLRSCILDLDLEEYDDIDMDFDLDLPLESEAPVLLYAKGEETMGTCVICYDVKKVYSRLCCGSKICDNCMDLYLEMQVNDGHLNSSCPDDVCTSYIHRDEILARLDDTNKAKFYRFLVDANQDPCVKTCPRCSHIKRVQKDEIEGKIVKKKGLQVTCEECKLAWCFSCQAPWHVDMSCRQYRKGEQLLQKWAREMQSGQLNAQKCPSCKIFIQRVSGCDHMTCSSCKTGFCYRCGKKFRSLKLFGNHFSRYSPFGCKYNLLPNRPGTRRFIRGIVFGGKILASVTLGVLAVAAGAALVGASVVVVPAIVGYKIRKKRRRERKNRQWEVRNANLRMMESRNFANIYEVPADFEHVPHFDPELDQNVRVIIHHRAFDLDSPRPLPYDSDSEDSFVTLTNVREETTEDGYTRFVAHIVSQNAESNSETHMPKSLEENPLETLKQKAESLKQKGESLILEGESLKQKGESLKQKGESLKQKRGPGSKVTETDEKLDDGDNKWKEEEATSSDGSVQKTKNVDTKLTSLPRDITKSKKIDTKMTKEEKEKSLDNKSTKRSNENDLLEIELNSDTNGCFVNIFSKTINSWQGHETLPKTFATAKGSLRFRSSTWEKSGKKHSSMDIRTFSNLLASQSEKEKMSLDALQSEAAGCSESVTKEKLQLPNDYITHM